VRKSLVLATLRALQQHTTCTYARCTPCTCLLQHTPAVPAV